MYQFVSWSPTDFKCLRFNDIARLSLGHSRSKKGINKGHYQYCFFYVSSSFLRTSTPIAASF